MSHNRGLRVHEGALRHGKKKRTGPRVVADQPKAVGRPPPAVTALKAASAGKAHAVDAIHRL